MQASCFHVYDLSSFCGLHVRIMEHVSRETLLNEPSGFFGMGTLLNPKPKGRREVIITEPGRTTS